MTPIEEQFLRESNAIEDVYDDDSLEQAKIAWEYLKGETFINTHTVLKTHKILMLNQPLQPNEKGYFRKVPVWVGGREGMLAKEIPEAIDDWLLDVATSIKVPGKNGNNIKIDHITYEKIHPFVDGNGRSGRLLLNWQRLKAGLPILIIKEAEKQKYYEWFA